MKSRPPPLLHRRPRLVRSPSKINALKQFDHFQHADFESGLFLQLTRGSFRQRFAKFQCSPGNRPLSFQRFASPPDQEHSPVLDHHSPHANNRPRRILPPRPHPPPLSSLPSPLV